MKFFHGGHPGMMKGQFVLPPSITRAKSLAEFGNNKCDTTKVYVTTSFLAATMYAATIKKGEVYEVEPIGELKHDPDCIEEGLSFSCEKARITKRHKLSRNQRETVIYALTNENK